jgi:hypothetical protein
MATVPAFASVPKVAFGQVSTANTARDGTGTLVTIVTGAASGTRISSVRVTAAGTTTAGVVRLFLNDGTNTRLLAEILVPAITPSTTVAVFMWTGIFSAENAIILPNASWTLRASTHNAETFNVFATGGDF